MVHYISDKQLTIFDFKTPFNVVLSADNRWVVMSKDVPWDIFANHYISIMHATHGRPGISPRTILGALIIKHSESLSDKKVIETIQENVYMQFFVGLAEFQTEPIFDSSLFVTIRKRLGKEAFDKLNNALIKAYSSKVDKRNISKKCKEEELPPNKGKLQADATVADQYITFPTDAKILNSSRKQLDKMIDILYEKTDKSITKPRTYRRVIDKAFLNYSKKKRKNKGAHRKMNRKLLGCVKRNIKFVENLLPDPSELEMGKDFPFSKKEMELFETIKEAYAQQQKMHNDKTNTCSNRIVSIFQPHVRPILRGKQNSRVEFGSKLGVSLDNGFSTLETLSWNAYHEGKDLKLHVLAYFDIHGYFPELVQVDKAYSTRENRLWLKERNIRITAPPLGRKPKIELTQYQKTKHKKEAAERNHIEGKFGQGKNGYNLNKIRAKLKETSESWISCIFFIMNLKNYRKKSSCDLFLKLFIQQYKRFEKFLSIKSIFSIESLTKKHDFSI